MASIHHAKHPLLWMTLLLVLALTSRAGGLDTTDSSSSREFQRRLDRISLHDDASLLKLGAWAEREKLTEKADELYRRIIMNHPDHKLARKRLGQLAARRPLRSDSEASRQARSLLSSRFKTYETPRFIVFSEATPGWTRAQTARLERTHHQFLRFTKRMGLEPLPLKHKLVGVLFGDRDAYLRFANENDNASASWIAGYYAPGADRVVFYNVEQGEGISGARKKLSEMQLEINAFQKSARRAQRQGQRQQVSMLRQNISLYQNHLRQETARIDQFAASLSVATTVHESIHQLFFHTHVQSAYIEYPLWISEGLATTFETDDINRTFGPDREYDLRREEFFNILKRDEELLDLPLLVGLTKIPGDDDEMVRRVYHQSYALVTYLCRYRAKGMRTYLNLMLSEPPGEPTTARHREVFESAFGDIEKLEKRWLKHERSALARRSASSSHRLQ